MIVKKSFNLQKKKNGNTFKNIHNNVQFIHIILKQPNCKITRTNNLSSKRRKIMVRRKNRSVEQVKQSRKNRRKKLC